MLSQTKAKKPCPSSIYNIYKFDRFPLCFDKAQYLSLVVYLTNQFPGSLGLSV